jgi:hypothetical protein
MSCSARRELLREKLKQGVDGDGDFVLCHIEYILNFLNNKEGESKSVKNASRMAT